MDFTRFILFPTLLAAASYFDNPNIEVLNTNNFDQKVLKSTEIWFINFISTNDQKSDRLEPKWSSAAEEYKGKVRFGIVDMKDDKTIGSRYGITTYPTIKFFGIDKSQPPNYYYPGKKFEDNLKEAYRLAIDETKKISIENNKAEPVSEPPPEPQVVKIKARLEAPSKKQSGEATVYSASEVIEQQASPPPTVNTIKTTIPKLDNVENGVWIFNDKLFEEALKNEQICLICFYKAEGEVSQKLITQLPRIAAFFEGQIKVAKIDASLNPQFVSKYKIDKFPSLKLFNKNFDFDVISTIPVEIIAIVEEKYEELKLQPKVPQLISQSQFDNLCKESICMIAFIPKLNDTDIEARLDLIDIIYDLSTRERSRSMNFLWVEQGQYKELETFFEVSSIPTLISMGRKKSKFVVMKSPLNRINAIDFYSKVLRGGVPLKPFVALPEISTTEGWRAKLETQKIEKTHD